MGGLEFEASDRFERPTQAPRQLALTVKRDPDTRPGLHPGCGHGIGDGAAFEPGRQTERRGRREDSDDESGRVNRMGVWAIEHRRFSTRRRAISSPAQVRNLGYRALDAASLQRNASLITITNGLPVRRNHREGCHERTHAAVSCCSADLSAVSRLLNALTPSRR